MLETARATYPYEACGLIVRKGFKTEVVECENVYHEPTTGFTIPAEAYAAAEQTGEIVAVWHSHPNGTALPSEADKTMCEATGLPWHIVSWPEGAYHYFEPTGYVSPLEGRPFVFNIHDCYSLVRDYYARTLDIELPSREVEYAWWHKGQNHYAASYEAAGFVRVQEPRLHDVILMQFSAPVPHHAAVYLGDEQILHHLEGRLSRRDFYGDFYRKATALIVRHQSLC